MKLSEQVRHVRWQYKRSCVFWLWCDGHRSNFQFPVPPWFELANMIGRVLSAVTGAEWYFSERRLT